MRHNGADHQGLSSLDKDRAADLTKLCAWAKTAARYPKTATDMEAIIAGSDPLAHWLASSQPLLEELFRCWREAPQTTLEAHQVEYTRLFVARWGGVPAPLHASYYLNRETFRGDAADTAVAFYARHGVLWSETELQEPPDHLAVELEFLEILCQSVSPAPGRGENQARGAVPELWQDFWRSHFGLWTLPCAAAMEQHAKLPLYKVLALSLIQLWEQEMGHEGTRQGSLCHGL